MRTYRFELGTLTFAIEPTTQASLKAESSRAKRLADQLAIDLNKAFVQATLQGKLPGYVLQASVKELRTGSVLAGIAIHADVALNAAATDAVFGAVVASGLFKFLKDYPLLKKGILEIAKDIDTLTMKSFGILRRTFRAIFKASALHSELELESQTAAAQREITRVDAEREVTPASQVARTGAEDNLRLR